MMTEQEVNAYMAKWTVRLRDTNGNYIKGQKLPFAEVVTFAFTEEALVDGYAVTEGKGENKTVIFEERWQGGPFRIPPGGGSVEVNLGSLTLDGIKISDILRGFQPPAPKSKYRNILEPWEAPW
jgi:hypothetical protein